MFSENKLHPDDFDSLFSHIGTVRVLEHAGFGLDHLADKELMELARRVQDPHEHDFSQA